MFAFERSAIDIVFKTVFGFSLFFCFDSNGSNDILVEQSSVSLGFPLTVLLDSDGKKIVDIDAILFLPDDSFSDYRLVLKPSAGSRFVVVCSTAKLQIGDPVEQLIRIRLGYGGQSVQNQYAAKDFPDGFSESVRTAASKYSKFEEGYSKKSASDKADSDKADKVFLSLRLEDILRK